MTQVIYLKKYDWLIKVFYIDEQVNADMILNELDQIDCPPDIFYPAAKTIEYNNTGFTYTDIYKHVTFIIIGNQTCPKEFMNTYIHEAGHAAMHISEYYGIDVSKEEYLYLIGDIVLEMFDVTKYFLCEHCKKGKH